MARALSRRGFVSRGLQAGALAGLGELGFLGHLPPVSGQQARPPRSKVRFTDEMEPLVRLIEETPRERLFEAMADQIRHDTSYQQILTALLLAGVRSIQPRPVGFKFHAVLVVNSAHLASLAAPDRERWLPLFWALDNFKHSQAENVKQGDWVMRPVAESSLPPAAKAKERFIEAMDSWDEEGADLAIVSLVRSASAAEIIELFWRYGARDFRDIGHKAIYVANAWRTLQTIGWRHAEPVLRSLTYALLDHEPGNPATRDAEPDQPWRENLSRAAKIPADWRTKKADAGAVARVLDGLRTTVHEDACGRAAEELRSAGASVVWDALFLRAGELLMQQPGIIGLHCVTSVNALYYAFQTAARDDSRKMLTLQAAAFLALFRKRMTGPELREHLRIDSLEKGTLRQSGTEAVSEILADVSGDRLRAARKTIAALEAGSVDPQQLLNAARRLIFSKGTDSHDYKFASAALEDYYHTSPTWRNRFLATSMFNLRGSKDPDNSLILRAKQALGTA